MRYDLKEEGDHRGTVKIHYEKNAPAEQERYLAGRNVHVLYRGMQHQE